MKELTPQTATLVQVDWSDIVADDNWDGGEGLIQPVEAVTVGWLIDESPTMVTIASSYDYRAQQWASLHTFPKTPPQITKIKEPS